MTGDCIHAVVGIDAAAYFKGRQDRRNMLLVYYTNIRVPIESREIGFPPGKFISRELTTLSSIVIIC